MPGFSFGDFATEAAAWDLRLNRAKLLGNKQAPADPALPFAECGNLKHLQDMSENAFKLYYQPRMEEFMAKAAHDPGFFVSLKSALLLLVPQTRFWQRSLVKPLGYAGDYLMMQHIYDFVGKWSIVGYGSLTGWAIDRWVCSYAGDLRGRTDVMSDLIKTAGERWTPRAFNVLSIACGPFNELPGLQHTKHQGPTAHFTGLDSDARALQHVLQRHAAHARSASPQGLPYSLELHQVNVIRAARGKGCPNIPPQHLVFSIGLMDYLADAVFIEVVNYAHGLLMSGGELVIGNVAENDSKTAQVVKLWTCLTEWPMYWRSDSALTALMADTAFGMDGAISTILHGRDGLQTYVHVRKAIAPRL